MTMLASNPDLLMAVTFIAVFLFMAAIALVVADSGGGRVTRRLERMKNRHRRTETEDPERISVKRIAKEGWFKGFEAIARSLIPRPMELRARLARTGKEIPLGNYLAVCVALAVTTAGLGFFLFSLPAVIAVGLGVLAGAGLPHFVISSMINRRANKFITSFPDAIDLMVRGMKSGLPITESMQSVSKEIADPVGSEFRRIVDGVRLGQTLEDAMWEATQRLGVQEFKFFVISLGIQQETGGNLAETLQNLTDVLRKRQQMKLKIKAMSAEARASALIIGSLPFIMFGILLMLNYDYTSLLFTDRRGMMMMGAGLVSMGLGLGVIAKMVRFEI